MSSTPYCTTSCAEAGIIANSAPKSGEKYFAETCRKKCKVRRAVAATGGDHKLWEALTQKTKSQLDGRRSYANCNATFSRIVTQLHRQMPVSPAKDSGVTPGVVNLAESDAFVHESTEYVGRPNTVHRGMRSRYRPAKVSRQHRLSTRQVPARGNRSVGGVSASG